MQAADSLIEWSGTRHSTVGICERFIDGVAVGPAYSALPEQEHFQLKEVTESTLFDCLDGQGKRRAFVHLSNSLLDK
jgi:hypothetical protein